MKIDSIDLEPEDVYGINTRDRFNRHIDKDDVILSHSVPIVVRYDYIDLDSTKYHFCQTFAPEDIVGYFSRMKKFAGKSIDKLLSEIDPETKKNKYHFYRSSIRGELLRAVRQSIPGADPAELIVYHFSLYDSEVWADRASDTRNSRVYFILGTYGHIYILFFDPYHELNPITKN